MNELGLKARQSVRLSDATWDTLKEIAVRERERAQAIVTVSGIARKFVLEGIERWKREERKRAEVVSEPRKEAGNV